jgi:hypothetical protein
VTFAGPNDPDSAVGSDEPVLLGYRFIQAERRGDWLPRVRKISRDGEVSIVATVERK